MELESILEIQLFMKPDFSLSFSLYPPSSFSFYSFLTLFLSSYLLMPCLSLYISRSIFIFSYFSPTQNLFMSLLYHSRVVYAKFYLSIVSFFIRSVFLFISFFFFHFLTFLYLSPFSPWAWKEELFG